MVPNAKIDTADYVEFDDGNFPTIQPTEEVAAEYVRTEKVATSRRRQYIRAEEVATLQRLQYVRAEVVATPGRRQ